MGKLIKSGCKYPFAEVVANIDSEKFWIPITEEILKKNDWEFNIYRETVIEKSTLENYLISEEEFLKHCNDI